MSFKDCFLDKLTLGLIDQPHSRSLYFRLCRIGKEKPPVEPSFHPVDDVFGIDDCGRRLMVISRYEEPVISVPQ